VPCGDRLTPKGARTQEKILFTAGRHFARRGYAAVTLKDIAGEVGVTPAMVVRYFGSKRALFEAVARVEPAPTPDRISAEELAESTAHYWQDPDLRTPAIALLRSLDLDGGKLFQAELQRRVIEPLSRLITGPDADVRLQLATAVGMGFGLFSTGLLVDPDQPPLPEQEIKRLVPYLAKLMAICLDHPVTAADASS
jgi:AcrR family transcriptional regulator